jgi:SAM-dependent methyltransferase
LPLTAGGAAAGDAICSSEHVERLRSIAQWYEARVFHPLMDRSLRSPRVEALRRGLLREARGDAVEVGIGTGLNLPHYPSAVRSLRAVVREEHFDPRVAARAEECGRSVELVRGDAQDLPLESSSIDTLVCTFVLCSVDAPERALAEFARVLRPDGTLLIAEHVLSPRRFERTVQRALTPLHRRWACGCRLDRDLGAGLARTGWTLRPLGCELSRAFPFPASELLCGAAQRLR